MTKKDLEMKLHEDLGKDLPKELYNFGFYLIESRYTKNEEEVEELKKKWGVKNG